MPSKISPYWSILVGIISFIIFVTPAILDGSKEIKSYGNKENYVTILEQYIGYPLPPKKYYLFPYFNLIQLYFLPNGKDKIPIVVNARFKDYPTTIELMFAYEITDYIKCYDNYGLSRLTREITNELSFFFSNIMQTLKRTAEQQEYFSLKSIVGYNLETWDKLFAHNSSPKKYDLTKEFLNPKTLNLHYKKSNIYQLLEKFDIKPICLEFPNFELILEESRNSKLPIDQKLLEKIKIKFPRQSLMGNDDYKSYIKEQCSIIQDKVNSGIDICLDCLTWSKKCSCGKCLVCHDEINGECVPCYHKNKKIRQAKTAFNNGQDVCLNCSTIEPNRCGGCGACLECNTDYGYSECSVCYDGD